MADHKQFQGRISNADPADIPLGAAVDQENFDCLIPGRLTGRKGKRLLTFAAASGATSSATVRSMIRFQGPINDQIVYANSSGELVVVSTPTIP